MFSLLCKSITMCKTAENVRCTSEYTLEDNMKRIDTLEIVCYAQNHASALSERDIRCLTKYENRLVIH